jgi:enterochelin esterase family protein
MSVKRYFDLGQLVTPMSGSQQIACPCSYPHSLVKDVIPFVEKYYRVIANTDNRAIAGLSMGGGHTFTATNNNPGVFGWIAVFSSGPRGAASTRPRRSNWRR